MGERGARIAGLLSTVEPGGVDPHYVGFFRCFNEQRYFEAHEVLEALWLTRRSSDEGLFYKGLIQLAGAFVHVQKDRRSPAEALFRLARGNLKEYQPVFLALDITAVITLIERWLRCLAETPTASDLLAQHGRPVLNLSLAPKRTGGL